MFRFLKRHWWAVIYTVVLCGYSLFCILDTFMLPKAVITPNIYDDISDEQN